MRKGWYKKAKKKWFRERLYSFDISHGDCDISYNCYDGATLTSRYWKSEVIRFLWDMDTSQSRFWWAWQRKKKEFEGKSLSISYETKTI